MAESLSERQRAYRAETERQFRARAAEVGPRLAYEELARQFWLQGARSGAPVLARTPATLRGVGARVALGGPRAAAPRPAVRPILGVQPGPSASSGRSSERTPRLSFPEALIETDRQRRGIESAIISGAVDDLTFGLADSVSAGARTLAQGALPAVRGEAVDWKGLWDGNVAQERVRDEYDEKHHRAARLGGQVVGTIGSIILPGGLIVRGAGAAVRGARAVNSALRLGLREKTTTDGIRAFRAALARPARSARTRRAVSTLKSAPTSVQEHIAWMTGPGVANAVFQGTSDVVTRGYTTPQDVGGAFIGGVAAGLTRRFGPGRSAAVGAATTSLLQDTMNGRMPEPGELGRAGLAGNVFGAFGGQAGSQWSDGLSWTAKGRLGERLGAIRRAINGLPPDAVKKARDYLKRGYWIPDAWHAWLRFEDKFGFSARLSKAQTRALQELADNFVLYHFTPHHVGRVTAVAPGQIGAELLD